MTGSTRRRSDWLGDLAWGFIGLALLNLPMWMLANYGSVTRPTVNVDYALVLLAWCRGHRRCAFVLYLGLLLLDAAAASFSTFFFRTLTEWLGAMRFGALVGQTALAPYVASAVSGAALALLAFWLVTRRHADARPLPARALFAAAALWLAFDMANGSSIINKRDQRLIEKNVAGSQLVSIAAALTPWQSLPDPRPLPLSQSAMGHSGLGERLLQQAGERGVLVVLVESWGLPAGADASDTPVSRTLASRLEGLYTLSAAHVPFAGATTAAELREWCQLKGHYTQLSAASGRQCLPWQLKEQGWHTKAYHGYLGAMFNRTSWWPMLGFEDLHFKDIHAVSPARQCGEAFAGVCDQDMLRAGVAAASQPRVLAYVLTLQAHLPLDKLQPGTACAQLPTESVRRNCQLMALHTSMAESIADLLADGQGPDAVLLVGDHAPPFFDRETRQHWDLRSVPYVLLRRRAVP